MYRELHVLSITESTNEPLNKSLDTFTRVKCGNRTEFDLAIRRCSIRATQQSFNVQGERQCTYPYLDAR
ncbi:hypothetical protein ACGTRS_31300, partial [Burkholderia semiarida]